MAVKRVKYLRWTPEMNQARQSLVQFLGISNTTAEKYVREIVRQKHAAQKLTQKGGGDDALSALRSEIAELKQMMQQRDVQPP